MAQLNPVGALSHLTVGISLVSVVLVVPVLEVLVNGGLLGGAVLATHGTQTTANIGGLSVKSLVEGGVTRLILTFQSSRGHCEGIEGCWY